MRYLIVVMVMIVSGCVSKRETERLVFSQADIFSLESLKRLLGKDLNAVKEFGYAPGLVLKDTTFESEGEEWLGLVFYWQQERIVFMETNWQKQQTISRIVITSPLVAGSSGIVVGKRFGDVKGNLSSEIPSYPDGYFGLQDLNDPGITYFFDVSGDSDLSLGLISFDNIPDDLVITEVLVE
jgi:hypothetical protein